LEQKQKFILLVTGLSGAGKTEALHCLEDMGYECVDNMPLRLVSNMVSDTDALPDKLVLAVDSRNHDLESHYKEAIDAIRANENLKSHILYLYADEAEILRRYAESRRKHPFKQGDLLRESITEERSALRGLHALADEEIDTTDFKPIDFWRQLRQRYADPSKNGLRVFVMSFGFKHGVPREVDALFDVRYLKNPHWVEELRPHTGLEAVVQNYVSSDEEFVTGFENIVQQTTHAMKQFAKADRAYFTIGLGCTGGRHRSVTVAEKLVKVLTDEGFDAHVYHRDLT